MPCDAEGVCPFPGEPGTKGALSLENHTVVEIWQLYRALGQWAVDLIPFDMPPGEVEETVWLLYQLETENNALREQYTDHQKGTKVRLPWDLRG